MGDKDLVVMTNEQLGTVVAELTRTIGLAYESPEGKEHRAKLAGLGAPPYVKLGLGCSLGSAAGDVYQMLALGSPILAYAKLLGVRLAPYILNIRGTFEVDGPTDLPNLSNDSTKIVQDTLIDQMVVRVQPQVSPSASFGNTDAFFFQYLTGIEATLDVTGAPRYAVAPDFTPISNLADLVGGSHWPGGWVLGYQQQLKAALNASIPLPADLLPLEVILSFRGWVPVGETFVSMKNQQAIDGLAECGVQLDKNYQARVLCT
jgi:hypothetical protein